jgi:hypothetical protein
MQQYLAMITLLSGDGNRPDNALPPASGPVDPGYGHGVVSRPDNSLPNAPARPDNSLPSAPGAIMPPIYVPPGMNIPTFPSNPIAPGGPGGKPDNTLPTVPGTPDNSLPTVKPGGTIVLWWPGIGYVIVPVGDHAETLPGQTPQPKA